MDFTDSQYTQLILAMVAAIVLFAVVYRVSEKTTLGFLILMIPFQIIDTRFGTLNTVLTYLVAFAFLLQGRLHKLPYIAPVLIILFAFVMSFTQAHPASRLIHILYLFAFFGNVLLFYMVYNFLLRTGDWEFIFRTLVVLNVMVLIYCTIQFIYGYEAVTFFGIREFSMNPIRNDGRLQGPFRATALTAEYLVIQSIMLAYLLMWRPETRVRQFIYFMLAGNSLFLIATGNRGGFVSLVFGALLFLYMFRKQLGFARVTKMVIVGSTLFVIVALVAVNFTEYGMLFERLEGTTVNEGVPDTRSRVWPAAWERIQEAPILGHGPQLRVSPERDQLIANIPYMQYAHSLPLHILFTTGIVGLVAWIIFFWGYIGKLMSFRYVRLDDQRLANLARLGLVIIAVILLSQMRIEFLRIRLTDYQHYLFVLFAFFLASCDLMQMKTREIRRDVKTFGKPAESRPGEPVDRESGSGEAHSSYQM